MNASTVHRFVDQVLDAATLIYGLQVGARVATLYDATHAFIGLASIVALTIALPHGCDADEANEANADSRMHRFIETLLILTQRFAIYAFAYAARLRVSALFGGALSVAPLYVVALLGAFYVALWPSPQRKEPGVSPKAVLRTPLALMERFVEAIAFAYGLAASRALESWLLLTCFIVAASWLHSRLETTTKPMSAFSHWVTLTLDFCKQYAVYVMTRLLYGSVLVRAAPLYASIFIVTFIVAALQGLSRDAQQTTPVSCVASDLIERFLDALAIVAALSKAQSLSTVPLLILPLLVLSALLVASNYVSTHSSDKTAFGKTSRRLCALLVRYASYACVQIALARSHPAVSAIVGVAVLAAINATTTTTSTTTTTTTTTESKVEKEDIVGKLENVIDDATE